MSISKQTAKFIARIAENLPDMDETTMQGWIENPKSLQKTLMKAFCPPEHIWKTWKIVKLGTLKNVDKIRKALKACGHSIGHCADDIIGKPDFKVSKTKQDVELIEVSNEELGFKDGARYEDTCKRAFELGLEYCPAEVGPQLRLQYKDQPKGTFVAVAMEAIADSGGRLSVFYVECNSVGELCLYACNGNTGHFNSHRSRFVFLRRKK